MLAFCVLNSCFTCFARGGILSQQPKTSRACLPSLCSCRACPALHPCGRGGGHGAPAPELLRLGGCHPGRWATCAAVVPASHSCGTSTLIQAYKGNYLPVLCSIHDDCAAGKAGIQAGIRQLAVRPPWKAIIHIVQLVYTIHQKFDHVAPVCTLRMLWRWAQGAGKRGCPTAGLIAQRSPLSDVLHVVAPK